jgi:hypothetical protein
MQIFVAKMLVQRYRALLHILDALVDRGDTVSIDRRKKVFDISDHFHTPWDISCANVPAFEYFIKNLGFVVQHLHKIQWLEKGSGIVPEIVLATDYMEFGFSNQVNLPYNDFYCRFPNGDKVLVGNGMCEAIRTAQENIDEIPGKLLITHPGAGRTILSPLRGEFSKKEVVNNSRVWFKKIFSLLPKDLFSEIVIKTHPAPYIGGNYKAFVNQVLPDIEAPCKLRVVKQNLIKQVCESEYILTFGSSTTIWLLGSSKKWVNTIDCSNYNLESDRRRDRIERAERWYDWPQNVSMKDIAETFCNYEKLVQEADQELLQKYRDIHNMNTTKNILEVLDSVVS